MTPDQAKFLLHFLLPQINSERSVTSRILRTVPPGSEDYRPDPLSRSALALVWHIVVVEMWFLDAVIHQRFGEIGPRPPEIKTCRDAGHWYDQQFTARLPLLQVLRGEALARPVDYLDLRNDPAVAYLNIAIRHSVHHRGQLSAYLRPMGAKVPAIYVESGDEPYSPEPGTPAAENPQSPPAF